MKPETKNLFICGPNRSGTSLLRKLLNTNEFINLSDIELNFSYDYFTPDDESGCPFNQIDRKYFGHKNGVVIHRNSLTELLVEYLLMDYTELSQYTGSITPMAYKLIVLKSICELW